MNDNQLIATKDRLILEAFEAGRIRPTDDGRVQRYLKKSRRWMDTSESTCPNGYRRFVLDGVRFRTHRAILIMSRGLPPSGGLDAGHLSGDRADNRPENLRWLTRSANCQQAVDQGTMWQAKIGRKPVKLEDHALARKLYAAGWSRGMIARTLAISMGCVARCLAVEPRQADPPGAKPFHLVSPDGRHFTGTNLREACSLLGLGYWKALDGRKRHKSHNGGWWHAEDLPNTQNLAVAA